MTNEFAAMNRHTDAGAAAAVPCAALIVIIITVLLDTLAPRMIAPVLPFAVHAARAGATLRFWPGVVEDRRMPAQRR